jgi:streptogramin lyase
MRNAHLFGLGLLLCSAVCPAQVTFTEYPLPTVGSFPFGIAAGPDGNLWFTEDHGNGNKIGRITTAGVITEFPTPTPVSTPTGITAGPDGNLWFTEKTVSKIGRITTAGVITEFPTPPGDTRVCATDCGLSYPYGITAGPDGALWFTEANASKIGRITTAGVITEFSTPTASESTGITAGPDGNLWFIEQTANKIGRITTAGIITEFSVSGSSGLLWITAGPDGNLWFTDLSGNQIGRITTSGVVTLFPIPTGGSLPVGITAGPDGNLWFTEQNGNQIGRITTAGVITEFPVPTASSAPQLISAGPDGNIWFTEYTGNKIVKLSILPPDLTATKANNVGGTIALGGNWTWTIRITNAVGQPATFASGKTILRDNLPNASIGYGTPTVGNIVGTVANSGAIGCGISASDLVCTANSLPVTLDSGSSFDVSFTATPSAAGIFANPRVGGICAVDPENNITETIETNNSCGDSVTVGAPDLTATKSNNVGGSTTFDWIWKITVANSGNAPANFINGQTILADNLPINNISYGTPVASRPDVNCNIASGTLICTANAATVTLTAGSSFDVSVTGTATAAGVFTNPRAGGSCTVDPNNNIVEASESNNFCSDTVTVGPNLHFAPRDASQVIDPANLQIGDSVVNLTNTGTRNGFDPAGGICANLYTFDPSEEMISCCACYITPDGLRSLSVKQDLVSNTLTPGVPGSVVIRLLATTPVTGATCDPSSPTVANLASGMRAWGTNLHQNTASGRYEITEGPSLNTVLSDTELAKLASYCGFIQANGSGFGICKSCRLGGLGGATGQ